MSHYKPYPVYKDSRVEWLGQVPEHWAVCKLSFRYSIELGKMLDEKKLTKTSLVPYLRNQDVQWGSINIQDLPEMDIHPEELKRYTIQDSEHQSSFDLPNRPRRSRGGCAPDFAEC